MAFRDLIVIGGILGVGYVWWHFQTYGRYPWQPEPILARVRPRRIVTAKTLKTTPDTYAGIRTFKETTNQNLGSYIITNRR